VRRKLKEIQPDIVHGQGTERDCAISAVFSGFPNVVTIHGNMRSLAKLNRARPFSFFWLAARLEGFVLPRAGGVVCITSYTRNLVQNRARQTWIVPNAVDQSFFEVNAAPDPAGPPVGLCVGQICGYKNQNAFIQSLDALAGEKKFRIVFLGRVSRDAYGTEFLKLVKERPWCEHAGWAGRDELQERMRAASFIAHPTREDNCPMVVLEAMAAGVPVFASKIGGVPDLIEPEKTGLLCDPDRPESLREAVAKLLAGRDFARQMAATAKAEALRRFHPQVIAERHLEIYRQILGGTA
jgi:glycosyltransferase involved in cell wall biosynthesis